MLKKIVTKTVIASLAALISVPNIVTPTTTYASIESDMVSEGINGAGCTLYQIVSTSPYGNYTKIVDECDNHALVHTSQWNEYQLMLQQGSPEVIAVFAGWSEENFYTISGYQLAGQAEVNLPKDKLIKITDPYNCDHLSVLKYLGNTLGSSYLFNQTAREQEIKQNNARIDAERAAKQKAEAQRSAEESARNAQINAEMWTTNNDKYHITTQLLYTKDYLRNYNNTELTKSQEKLWNSFDNERNYVQKWLDKHNLTLKQLRDMNYTTVNLEENSKKYGKQMYQANVYFKLIEQGKLPKNCSTGDWIRFMLKTDAMSGWNWCGLWDDNIDFTPISDDGFIGFGALKDIYRINIDIYNMIEKIYL